jgi:hypothetical protein
MTPRTCNLRSYPKEELLNLCKMSLPPFSSILSDYLFKNSKPVLFEVVLD